MTFWPAKIDGNFAVIGDVHGQIDKLRDVLSQLAEQPGSADRWIVFVGDLVDRGPNPRAVIEEILELKKRHEKTTAVMGNHDLAMAASCEIVTAIEVDDWRTRWLDHYESETTLKSYNAAPGDVDALQEALPESHVEMISALPWLVEHPDYLIVHAGLEPATDFEMQLRILRHRDFTLRRPNWLCEHGLAGAAPPVGCKQTIVSGHVAVEDVHYGRQRILCDTSGGRTGPLSCVLLPERLTIQSEPASETRSTAEEKDSDNLSGSWRRFWPHRRRA